MTSQALEPAVVHPTTNMQKHQWTTEQYYDRSARKLPPLDSGDQVLMRRPEEKCWSPATVIALHGSSRSYTVDNGNNLVRRNRVHLKPDWAGEYRVKQPEDNTLLSSEGPVLDSPVDEPLAVALPTPASLPRRSLRANKGTLPARYKNFDMQ